MKRLKLDRLSSDEQIELDEGMKKAVRASANMLDSYTQMGIIRERLRAHLQKKIAGVLQRVSVPISSEQSWREVYLACLRVEFSKLEQMYEASIVSQYTYLERRSNLLQDRDNFHINRIQQEISGGGQTESLYKRVENWLLKKLRDKNWAVLFLSSYQRRRLIHRIQHDIAGIVMTHSVVEMLQSNHEFDRDACRVMLKVYQHRYLRWKNRLDCLRRDFAELFDKTEKELFTQATFAVAEEQVGNDLHHGEIGIKAYNRIKSSIDSEINREMYRGPVELTGTIKKISNIPLFSKLSDASLKALSKHIYSITFLAGDIIINEGERGDALYIIEHGRAEVTRTSVAGEKKYLGTLADGDFFGERGLLDDHQRTATVTAVTAMTLLSLRRNDIMTVAKSHPGIKHKLEQVRDSRPLESHEKDQV